ncbi:hypothetical protein [Parapedobacter soli]|uniref:hypothetical protein n=1 Tax=Parapedobacter soli TaxID=416955 RepID=UPI0021C922C7|nr:hypothetical protein [Parapedobacter soli]
MLGIITKQLLWASLDRGGDVFVPWRLLVDNPGFYLDEGIPSSAQVGNNAEKSKEK